MFKLGAFLSVVSHALDSTSLRMPPVASTSVVGGKSGSSIALDRVLHARNLTAVVVGAKAISNNTIQVVLEANITAQGTPLATSTLPEKPQERLNVQLIYGAGDIDSLTILKSPDFVNFFTRPSIMNRTHLELTPYGRATEIDVNTLSPGFLFWHPELRRDNITRVYRCPNGESECESNLIHSCAILISKNDPSIYLPFIGCMSTTPRDTSPEDSSFTCSNSTNFMESLKDCALGTVGVELQHSLAHKAADASTIPSFIIDGHLHPFNVSRIADLPSVLCDVMFAKGILDRDVCMSGKETSKFSAPFESLLTPSGASGPAHNKLTR